MVDKTTDNKLKIISLYRSNYLAKYHVREIAKLTHKSHVTLLPHLKALEKEKVLTPKTIGKNKVYSIRLDNDLAMKYLLLSETIETIITLEEVFLLKKVTSEFFNLNLGGTIILFGSYAKRTFKEDSDIDVFYIGKIEEREIQEMRKIGRVYGKTINVKKSTMAGFESGLRRKDSLIIEVVKNHVLLQNAEPFISALWRFYNERR